MSTDTTIIQESLRLLSASITNASLYGMAHPQVKKLAESAYNGIYNAFNESPEISLVVVEGELVVNGEPPVDSLFLSRFAETLTDCKIGHLKLIAGLAPEELAVFISGMAAMTSDVKKLSSTEHLRVGQADLATGGEQGDSNGSKNLTFEELPAEELSRFTEIYELLGSKKKIKISGLAEIVSAFIETFRQEGETRLVMAALRSSDTYSFTHSANVCILNLIQAIELGIEGKTLHEIGLAAMLHDIGKLFISEEILTTSGPLTDEQFEKMRQHPALGAQHLLEIPGVPRLAIVTAYEHHMRHDLSGYPHAPEGWQPNLSSQITMISDFFDAMRTKRPHRNALDLKTIVGMMREKAGTEFHPLLTRNFLTILKRVVTNYRTSLQ